MKRKQQRSQPQFIVCQIHQKPGMGTVTVQVNGCDTFEAAAASMKEQRSLYPDGDFAIRDNEDGALYRHAASYLVRKEETRAFIDQLEREDTGAS